jgi:16S rRNA (guanine966-N2)-methyltransferase
VTRIVAGAAGGRTIRVPPAVTRPTSERVREALFSLLESRLGGRDGWAGKTAADLYAGSGAFALEALSRGAAWALAVDSSPAAVRTIQANAAALGLTSRLTVRRGRVEALVAAPPPPGPGATGRPARFAAAGSPDGAPDSDGGGGPRAARRSDAAGPPDDAPGTGGARGPRAVRRVHGPPFDVVFLDPPYDLAWPLAEAVLTALANPAVAPGAAAAWLADGALVALERSARTPAPNWPPGWQSIGNRTYGDTALHLARVRTGGEAA